MKTKITALVFGLALFFSMGGVLAQDTDGSDEMEATMRLMGKAEAELPDAVTKEIKLPDHLLQEDSQSQAAEASAHGLRKANENRLRREEGLLTADEASEHGAEMVEQAQENRENRGRSEDRPEPPDPPGPPNGPPGE